MKAVAWHGKRDVRVEDVPDPTLKEPNDAIVRVTSSDICGSDLRLYEVFEQVGPAVDNLEVGDRVVVPFNISCGTCFMCRQGLYSQCEKTQVTRAHKGAALLGYTRLYGEVPGGQAELLRVPEAQFGPIKVPHGPSDDHCVYLSDVLPTAWQAVEYAAMPDGGSLLVLGLGPIGDMATRVAQVRGVRQVIAADIVAERLERAQRHGVHTFDLRTVRDLPKAVRDLTDGRGADAVIDAVRRGGTISISGVYGGMTDPLPMMVLFDKQVQLRMGQANIKRWVPDLLPYLQDESDPLGVESFAIHHLPLSEAPHAYEIFQTKSEGAVKVLLEPQH